MALSSFEKKELDNVLKEIVSKVNDFTTADVALYSMSCRLSQLKHDSINASAIKASLERLRIKYSAVYPSPIKYVFDNNPNKKSLHEIVKDMVIVNPHRSFYKNKNILNFEARNMHMYKKFSYDFITKENDFGDYKMAVEYGFDSFDDIIKLFDYEWIFNYATSFAQVQFIIDELKRNNFDPKVMPKNYSRYLDMYNNHRVVISRCKIDRDYSNYSAKERGFIFNCIDMKCGYEKVIDILPPNQLLKVVENTICLDSLNWASPFRDLVDVVCDLQEEELDFTLDINRTMSVNLHNAENLLENHRNQELNAKLQKLNFVNKTLVGEGYIVIVPQNQAEKIDEGRQQNNCVGYYYDSSIVEGRNYIYFIRKIGSPNKSYLTCRFNVGSRATVEARYKNNVGISTTDEALIKAVDKVINLHINELL